MRADRLVSLVLLLRRHGRMSAAALARELEVSTRTVLRDIEALSAAGVPVYAERGRHGGFALLPGFRTELTGLNRDEALALLVAGSRRGAQAFGLGAALASAMRKVADALPESDRAAADDAARRLLVDPGTDLLARPTAAEEEPGPAMAEIRSAVLCGHRLRIRYAAANRPPEWRTVDPVGLVTADGIGYLLAIRSGEDRTYRLSRVLAAEELAEPARRPDRVDLDRAWRERAARFRTGGDRVGVLVRVAPRHREELAGTALAVRAGGEPGADGLLRVEAAFQDAEHAEWALWRIADGAEVLAPQWLRARLRDRAAAIAARHAEPSSGREGR
ncbi:helix-turn-helix transcriptional regulator [Nocardiopsis potens]|uniref:helix-turn-helix transcriptional regulator n=1 Tax=Nocardiopsis potens TaxID=1246458 RepID=UPI00034D4BE7|nr:WYL domain-containing protein [Nocardiopsis potens]